MDCSHEGLANDIISESTKNSRKSRQVKVVWRELRVSYDKNIEKVGLGENSVPKRVLMPKFPTKFPLTEGGGDISPTPYICAGQSTAFLYDFSRQDRIDDMIFENMAIIDEEGTFRAEMTKGYLELLARELAEAINVRLRA